DRHSERCAVAGRADEACAEEPGGEDRGECERGERDRHSQLGADGADEDGDGSDQEEGAKYHMGHDDVRALGERGRERGEDRLAVVGGGEGGVQVGADSEPVLKQQNDEGGEGARAQRSRDSHGDSVAALARSRSAPTRCEGTTRTGRDACRRTWLET